MNSLNFGPANADRRGMSSTPLRLGSGARFRRGHVRHTIEALNGRIGELVAERQRLHAAGAAESVLERNRVRIARTQWELSHALVERYALAPVAAQPVAETAAA